ncbi:hypothetical protein Pmani_013407 [Petrolisthes manimaculis]|uniref:Uncharacterized protein n=1 Tax=Petrolisthes manimaculis TaxID=1843537 RepID=A0AAE1PW28_9EUCA|nr:hypothetical protein Pmani_013407 [Petrolisthes manimaculis]
MASSSTSYTKLENEAEVPSAPLLEEPGLDKAAMFNQLQQEHLQQSGGDAFHPQYPSPPPPYSEQQSHPVPMKPYPPQEQSYPPPQQSYPPPQQSYPAPHQQYPPPQQSYPPPHQQQGQSLSSRVVCLPGPVLSVGRGLLRRAPAVAPTFAVSSCCLLVSCQGSLFTAAAVSNPSALTVATPLKPPVLPCSELSVLTW